MESVNIKLQHSCKDQITLNMSWSSGKNVVTPILNKRKNKKEHKLPLLPAKWDNHAQRTKYISFSLFTWGVGEEFNFPFIFSKAVSVECTFDLLIVSLCALPLRYLPFLRWAGEGFEFVGTKHAGADLGGVFQDGVKREWRWHDNNFSHTCVCHR